VARAELLMLTKTYSMTLHLLDSEICSIVDIRVNAGSATVGHLGLNWALKRHPLRSMHHAGAASASAVEDSTSHRPVG
jgi:hypothetical protein